MSPQSIKLADINTSAGTQIRAKVNFETVDEYAEAMQGGAKFPPVVVFHDGIEYILADGFHRVMAAARNQFKDILADVRKGTKSDALKFALGANVAHGLKRTNADKRRSVMLAVEAWPKLNDQAIADICGVSRVFVYEYRKELVTVTSSDQPEKRIGKDGKERPTTYTKKEKQPEPPVTPTQPPEPPHIQTAGQVMATNESQPDGELVTCQNALEAFQRSFRALTKEANRETIRQAVKFNLERM